MLLLYSLATLLGGAGYYPLTAIAGSAAGLALLFVTRLAAGAGIGAENVVIDAYVAEVVPLAWTSAAPVRASLSRACGQP